MQYSVHGLLVLDRMHFLSAFVVQVFWELLNNALAGIT